jgi:hypothetical protein
MCGAITDSKGAGLAPFTRRIEKEVENPEGGILAHHVPGLPTRIWF